MIVVSFLMNINQKNNVLQLFQCLFHAKPIGSRSQCLNVSEIESICLVFHIISKLMIDIWFLNVLIILLRIVNIKSGITIVINLINSPIFVFICSSLLHDIHFYTYLSWIRLLLILRLSEFRSFLKIENANPVRKHPVIMLQ